MIRLSFYIITVILANLSSLAQNNEKKFISAANSKLVYTGRFDFSNPAQAAFMYSGCSIEAVFSGTSIAIAIDDDSIRNFFTVIIDDSLFILKTDKPGGMYQLASGMPNKKHVLQVIRRTEWHGGNTYFKGLYIDKAAKLFKLLLPKKTIEFIGNSYTCGYGNEGHSHDEHFTYETENNYLSYGAVTARAVNAAYIGICRSGIGMYKGYGGDTGFIMSRFYDDVVNNKKIVWDYRKLQPDMVVIDLSANDFSTPVDSLKFCTAYLNFLKRVRNNYHHAAIVCIAGPSGGGSKWKQQQNFITNIVTTFGKTNKLIFYFEFTPFQMNGSDWHPNVAEHAQMAAELIPFIRKLM